MVGVFQRGSRLGQTFKFETTYAKAWGITAHHMAALLHIAFLLPQHRLYTPPPPPRWTHPCRLRRFFRLRKVHHVAR